MTGATRYRVRGRSHLPMGMGLCVALALATCVPKDSHADPGRKGLWVSGGGGWVDAKVDCRECVDVRFEPTTGVRLAIGGTPSQHVRLGLELFGLKRDETRQILAVLGTRWNPSTASGFHVRAGYGLAHGRQGFVVDNQSILATNTGIAWVIGAGWDVPAGPIDLSPSASMLVGAYGSIETDEGVLQDTLMTSYWIGIELTLP